MGETTKKVEDLLRDGRFAKKNQPKLAELEELYAKLLKAGVIRKPEYDLPLLDTLGCRVTNAVRHQRHDSDLK